MLACVSYITLGIVNARAQSNRYPATTDNRSRRPRPGIPPSGIQGPQFATARPAKSDAPSSDRHRHFSPRRKVLEALTFTRIIINEGRNRAHSATLDQEFPRHFGREADAARGAEHKKDLMYPCSTWLGKVGLVAWQFLQSPEGGRTIAAVGGLLVILYHVRRGAVPAGRPLAALLSVIFIVFLSAIVLLAVASWDANMDAQCSAYAPHRILRPPEIIAPTL
jgi:hypothetical protein